jgi:hypothetical protein
LVAHTRRTSACRSRVSPKPAELAGLQGAQQLGLAGQGQFADLVQEQRAPVGELEQPHLVLDRAGEGAADVAEQLAGEGAPP